MNMPYVKSNDEFDMICNGCTGNDWEQMLIELSKKMVVYYEQNGIVKINTRPDDYQTYNKWFLGNARGDVGVPQIRYTPEIQIIDNNQTDCLDKAITTNDVLYNKFFKLTGIESKNEPRYVGRCACNIKEAISR